MQTIYNITSKFGGVQLTFGQLIRIKCMDLCVLPKQLFCSPKTLNNNGHAVISRRSVPRYILVLVFVEIYVCIILLSMSLMS